jgi:hypothetical protein
MEFLGNFIDYYCRRSLDMNTNIILKTLPTPLKAGEFLKNKIISGNY